VISRSAMGARSIRVFRGRVLPRFTLTTNFVFFMERSQDIEDEDTMTFFGGGRRRCRRESGLCDGPTSSLTRLDNQA
jgi:hypothetical protein